MTRNETCLYELLLARSVRRQEVLTHMGTHVRKMGA
nr:MAG TPA: hypothetical protein [Caudoviricetes sp.]